MSVPSNIAEGYGRPGKADYIRFPDIARGSANEVETQLMVAEQVKRAMGPVNEVQRLLKGLVDSIEKKRKTGFRADWNSCGIKTGVVSLLLPVLCFRCFFCCYYYLLPSSNNQ